MTGAANSVLRSLAWLAVLIVAFGTSAPAASQPDFPNLSGRVVDQAGVLRSSTELAITEQLRAHEAETSNQIVVVTLRSLQGYSIEDFGVRLGRHWGIGQEGRDNGVLLIVAPNDRKVRIEVGYGLEGALTDGLARTIIDTEILPDFRRGNLERGVRAGTDAILAAIAGTYEAPTRSSRSSRSGGVLNNIVPIFVIGLFGFVVLRFISDAFGDGRSGNRVRIGDNYYDMPESDRDRRRDNTWSGGGYSGGGGGGFSGGGGSFGGGGASGSW